MAASSCPEAEPFNHNRGGAPEEKLTDENVRTIIAEADTAVIQWVRVRFGPWLLR